MWVCRTRLGSVAGTVLLEDFEHADAIFIFGQNPGTNSPRMMTSLRNASRRGARIISFNPFRERSLERFQSPQNPIEMATMTSTPISTCLYQVRVGGDVAVLKGLMKAMIEADDAALVADEPSILDRDFIHGHTQSFEALAADLRMTSWEAIERHAGLSRDDLTVAAQVYWEAPSNPARGMGTPCSTVTARRMYSKSQNPPSYAAISGARAPAYVRCAATQTCRVIAPSASPKSRRPNSLIGLNGLSASRHREPTATMS